jgi:mitochondrial fission protein ELM1
MNEARHPRGAAPTLRPRAIPPEHMRAGVDSAGEPGSHRSGGPPRVWAILCYRAGDNEQILALAEALGWPFEVKRLVYRPYARTIDVLRPTTLLGILRHESDPLAPPWPDLIISASVRNEPVCRWIQQQADHPVRYVHIGRPWALLRNFDLVITQPQYRLRRRANVLEIPLCLHRVSAARLSEAARQWTLPLADRPRPFIAVLVGGSGGPYAFDAEKAGQLARKASALANERGGSLLVSTSLRTAPAAAKALVAGIDAPSYVHLWQPAPAANPYFAFLALADAVIVTCDSISMLSEACATGKPVYMYDLGPSGDEALASLDLRTVRRRLRQRSWLDRLKALLYGSLVHVPPHRMTRDLALVHRHLIRAGRVAWFGEPFPERTGPATDDLAVAAARVRALLPRAGMAGFATGTVTPAEVE